LRARRSRTYDIVRFNEPYRIHRPMSPCHCDRARIVQKRHDFHTPEPQFLDRPLYNQADLLSATVGPTVNESIVHLSVAFWLFPPHDDGLLWNRQKCEAAMEPTLFHRILQSVITRGMRKVASLVRSIKVHPQIAVYGSQRMCRSCGAITARSKPFCLECGELLPAV